MKYVASVADRWRWQLPIRVADYTEMLDGNYMDRTADQQWADLDAAIRSVAPITFVDVDGTSYGVKVTAGQSSIAKFEMVGGYPSYERMWYLSLLQVSAND